MSLGIVNDGFLHIVHPSYLARSFNDWLEHGHKQNANPIRYGDKVKARVMGGTCWFVGTLEWVDGELCALTMPNGKFSDVFSTQSIVRV